MIGLLLRVTNHQIRLEALKYKKAFSRYLFTSSDVQHVVYLPLAMWAPMQPETRSNLGSVHHIPIMAGWTEAVLLGALLHLTSTGNRTPDLLILSQCPIYLVMFKWMR